ncbi:type II toxin-antitoxin system HicB family antitoxin [Nitrosopumilus sp.]|uniref:type II toxin-antitoxin system HicB family antitoxin n=1 Tax=Nitrosopumilus sp. TaxID=2024843 RepID=UPI00292CE44E|nr:type II toxin-antitoxin system HicB family antitoxin [Nitrosopumilus sp.]
MKTTQKEGDREFTTSIQKEPEGGYSGQCLGSPWVISQGETLSELKDNMCEAIQISLEYLKDKAKSENKKMVKISA